MPGANVHFGFLPETNRVAFVKELLGESIRNGQLAGVVPISGGQDVYRYLMDNGIPAVVFGSLYSSGDRLTSVDVDNREMARLLVGHLVERGHRRIAVVDNSRGCPGDNDFFDGVSESLASAGLPPTAALMRFMPDMESLFSQVCELLSMDDPPTGFVARSLRLADMVQQVTDECGDRANKQEIVFLEHRIPVGRSVVVHACATKATARGDRRLDRPNIAPVGQGSRLGAGARGLARRVDRIENGKAESGKREREPRKTRKEFASGPLTTDRIPPFEMRRIHRAPM